MVLSQPSTLCKRLELPSCAFSMTTNQGPSTHHHQHIQEHAEGGVIQDIEEVFNRFHPKLLNRTLPQNQSVSRNINVNSGVLVCVLS